MECILTLKVKGPSILRIVSSRSKYIVVANWEMRPYVDIHKIYCDIQRVELSADKWAYAFRVWCSFRKTMDTTISGLLRTGTAVMEYSPAFSVLLD